MDDHRSLIEILAELAQGPNGHLHDAPHLYRLVAERIRSRLEPAEAKVVADWFDRLARGDDPRDIFVTKSRGGRPPKGSDGGVDDYDIAWIVHLAIERDDGKPGEVYKQVAKAHNKAPRTIANIYSRLKPEIAKLAQGQIKTARKG